MVHEVLPRFSELGNNSVGPSSFTSPSCFCLVASLPTGAENLGRHDAQGREGAHGHISGHPQAQTK